MPIFSTRRSRAGRVDFGPLRDKVVDMDRDLAFVPQAGDRWQPEIASYNGTHGHQN